MNHAAIDDLGLSFKRERGDLNRLDKVINRRPQHMLDAFNTTL